MSKNRNRLTKWIAGVVLIAAGLLAAIVGVPAYRRATATPLHPQAQSAPSVAKPEPLPEWSEAVVRARRIVRDSLAEQNLAGLSVAVGVGDQIVWAEGFGWSDIETRAPVTPDTRFRMGTASKVLTSAAVGVLLENDRMKLDERIQNYVPQFPKKQWPVTLRQLMGDVAGITTDNGNTGPLFSQRCQRPADALQHFANRDLLFEPGTQYGYSNYGWILVSAAVEAAANQPFLTFMREQIFHPLGMNGTGAESSTEENPDHVGEPSEDFPLFTLVRELILEPLGFGGVKAKSRDIPDRATFYIPRFDADPRHGVHVMRPHNLSCYAGSMAFLSTSPDLVRFGLAINNGTLLQPGTVQLLQTPQQLTFGQQTGHGLGWDLDMVTLAGEPAQVAGEDGESLGGRVASLMMFRDRRIVVAVLSNIAYADTSSLARKVADAFAYTARRINK